MVARYSLSVVGVRVFLLFILVGCVLWAVCCVMLVVWLLLFDVVCCLLLLWFAGWLLGVLFDVVCWLV